MSIAELINQGNRKRANKRTADKLEGDKNIPYTGEMKIGTNYEICN